MTELERALSTLRDAAADAKYVKKPEANNGFAEKVPTILPGYLCAAFCVFMQRYSAVLFLSIVLVFTKMIMKNAKPLTRILTEVGISVILFFIAHVDEVNYLFAVGALAVSFLISLIYTVKKIPSAYVRKDADLISAIGQELKGKDLHTPVMKVLSARDALYPEEREGHTLPALLAIVVCIAVCAGMCAADPHISGKTGSGNYRQSYGHFTRKGDMYQDCPGGVRLVNWTGSGAEAVIPSEYEGKAVVAIGANAFIEADIVSAVIPDSVTSIGNGAFAYCANLRSLTLPQGLTDIPDSMCFGCSALTEVKIPSTVKNVHARAFYDCDALTSVALPEGLTAINAYAFADCARLQKADLPSTVRELHAAAFAGTALKSVTVPEGVTELHAMCFKDCGSLTEVRLPQSLTKISEYAFSQCKALETIALPKNLSNLGPYAFSGSGLVSIDIPGSVKAVKEQCFSECRNLKNVNMEFGVTRVGSRAFYACYSLGEVNCPASMKIFRGSAFRDCGELKIRYPFYTYVAERVFKDTKRS